MNDSAVRAQRAERDLGRRFWVAPARVAAGRRRSGRRRLMLRPAPQRVVGIHRAQQDHLHTAVGHPHLDLAADVAGRHRVTGRAEPDALSRSTLRTRVADTGPQ